VTQLDTCVGPTHMTYLHLCTGLRMYTPEHQLNYRCVSSLRVEKVMLRYRMNMPYLQSKTTRRVSLTAATPIDHVHCVSRNGIHGQLASQTRTKRMSATTMTNLLMFKNAHTTHV